MAKATEAPAEKLSGDDELKAVIEKAAEQGIKSYVQHLVRFRSAPPAITSKRSASEVYAGANELTAEIRSAAIGAANNGKVDVDRVCKLAEGILGAAAKLIDIKPIPEPFESMAEAAVIQQLVMPALRVALQTWNNQVAAPAKNVTPQKA